MEFSKYKSQKGQALLQMVGIILGLVIVVGAIGTAVGDKVFILGGDTTNVRGQLSLANDNSGFIKKGLDLLALGPAEASANYQRFVNRVATSSPEIDAVCATSLKISTDPFTGSLSASFLNNSLGCHFSDDNTQGQPSGYSSIGASSITNIHDDLMTAVAEYVSTNQTTSGGVDAAVSYREDPLGNLVLAAVAVKAATPQNSEGLSNIQVNSLYAAQGLNNGTFGSLDPYGVTNMGGSGDPTIIGSRNPSNDPTITGGRNPSGGGPTTTGGLDPSTGGGPTTTGGRDVDPPIIYPVITGGDKFKIKDLQKAADAFADGDEVKGLKYLEKGLGFDLDKVDKYFQKALDAQTKAEQYALGGDQAKADEYFKQALKYTAKAEDLQAQADQTKELYDFLKDDDGKNLNAFLIDNDLLSIDGKKHKTPKRREPPKDDDPVNFIDDDGGNKYFVPSGDDDFDFEDSDADGYDGGLKGLAPDTDPQPGGPIPDFQLGTQAMVPGTDLNDPQSGGIDPQFGLGGLPPEQEPSFNLGGSQDPVPDMLGGGDPDLGGSQQFDSLSFGALPPDEGRLKDQFTPDMGFDPSGGATQPQGPSGYDGGSFLGGM